MKVCVLRLVVAVVLVGIAAGGNVPIAHIRQDALRAANQYRSHHGAPALTLSATLNNYAQAYANKMAKIDKVAADHSGGPYGENLYFEEGIAISGKAAVDDWYKEVSQYNFEQPGFGPSTGHFTQLVWKASRQLGIGAAQGRSGWWYVVAEFSPPGNVLGAFPQNVQKPH